MSMKSEVEEALHAHSAWRKRFKDFLNGKASFDVAAVGDSHGCKFGDWLDHEGYRLMPEKRRTEVQEAHDEFHRVAAGIVEKIQQKKFAEAKEDLANEGPLNRASARLTEALVKAKLHEPSAVPPESAPKK
ncbi:MAG: CZB domain-containing protein, partial [Hylemonella sp.]